MTQWSCSNIQFDPSQFNYFLRSKHEIPSFCHQIFFRTYTDTVERVACVCLTVCHRSMRIAIVVVYCTDDTEWQYMYVVECSILRLSSHNIGEKVKLGRSILSDICTKVEMWTISLRKALRIQTLKCLAFSVE